MSIKDWISNWRQPEPARDQWAEMNEAIGSMVRCPACGHIIDCKHCPAIKALETGGGEL